MAASSARGSARPTPWQPAAAAFAASAALRSAAAAFTVSRASASPPRAASAQLRVAPLDPRPARRRAHAPRRPPPTAASAAVGALLPRRARRAASPPPPRLLRACAGPCSPSRPTRARASSCSGPRSDLRAASAPSSAATLSERICSHAAASSCSADDPASFGRAAARLQRLELARVRLVDRLGGVDLLARRREHLALEAGSSRDARSSSSLCAGRTATPRCSSRSASRSASRWEAPQRLHLFLSAAAPCLLTHLLLEEVEPIASPPRRGRPSQFACATTNSRPVRTSPAH